MELTFICPATKTLFRSDEYSLLENHEIIEVSGGQRELKGMVALNGTCPVCGQIHIFRVEDVICSLGGDK